jgi:hypothetical protein
MDSVLSELPLFNHPTAPHNGTETSRDAAQSIKKISGLMANQVLSYIRANPYGATCDEVEQALDMSHQTCSARFRDLASCEPAYIIKCRLPDGSCVKRKTRSGRKAFVYVANQEVVNAA